MIHSCVKTQVLKTWKIKTSLNIYDVFNPIFEHLFAVKRNYLLQKITNEMSNEMFFIVKNKKIYHTYIYLKTDRCIISNATNELDLTIQ